MGQTDRTILITLVFISILVFVFKGEPDIRQALVHWLMQ